MSRAERLAELLERARALDGAGREAFLATLRAADSAEVESLLAAGGGEPGLLDGSPWRAFERADGEAEEGVPEAIGPYRIVRPIGRGGMGRVFLAEQVGEAFRRLVALKVIDRQRLAPETVRRFREEVRILAGLEHPGIARFLDGGRTPDGTWFLALEFVEGRDLLTHAREGGLSTADRVRLFLAVLEAVAFAHSRGVVHRDLKPGNVLVGGDGRPRLLDFGIAKLVDPDDADEPAATRTELRAMTPAYASPEQFRGERATAAADVYSLGVVLYELISGARPYRSAASSRAELERAVLEEEPEPPSTAERRRREEAARAGEGAEADAAIRRSRTVDRDLDAICLKALRKEAGQRYASAAAFAEDLRRHLDGRPVEARRGGVRYRLSRLVRRRRVELAVAAAIVVALTAVLFAVRAGRRAELAASPPDPPPRPFPYSAVNQPPIDELEKRFESAPASVEAGAELALGLGRAGRGDEATLVIGRLRQIPGAEGDPLVDYAEAVLAAGRDDRQRALVLYERALASAVADGRGELVAQIRAARGRLLSIFGRREEARAEMEKALEAFVEANDQASLARVLNDLAVEVLQDGDLARGEKLLEDALAATRAASPTSKGSTFLLNLGVVAFQRGRPDIAEARLREVVRELRSADRPGRLGLALGNLGGALLDLGRPLEAAPAIEEAIRLLRPSGNDTELAFRLYLRGGAALAAGRLDDAERDAAEVEASAAASGSELGLGVAKSMRAGVAAARGEREAANRLMREAEPLLGGGDAQHMSDEVKLARAEMEARSGELDAARSRAEEVVAPLRRYGASVILVLGETLLARIDAARGEIGAAERRLARVGGEMARSPSVRLRVAFLRARAEVALARGDPAAARRDLEAAIETASAAARRLDELELRIELARAESAASERLAADATLARVANEAEALGLRDLAERARRLAAEQPGRD